MTADDRFTRIDRLLVILTWQIGGLAMMGIASLWLLLRIAAKVGAIG